jgi:hypothetical protein
MSTRVESPPIHGTYFGPVAFAIVIALAVGALTGSLVTRGIVDAGGEGSSALAVGRGAPSAIVWDAGKLEAMEGRQLAEQFRSEAGSAVVWDAGKLEAMEGRQLAEEARRHRPVGGPLG